MSEESERADQCPRRVDTVPGRGGRTGGEAVSLGGIDVEQANDGVIEAVEDGESGREVIKLLGNGEIYIPDGPFSSYVLQSQGKGRPLVWNTDDQTQAFMLVNANMM